MSRKDIREYLEKNILLFDGAMGTYLTSKDRSYRNAPEAANLEKPELIRDIHMEYLQAGSMAITTNTFGANRQNFPDDCDRIIERGYRLAEEAASKYNAFVFADIGPMDIGAIELPEDVDESEHEYIRIAGRFLELGATNFIFETHSIPDGIPEAARFIKEKNPDAFIIASFAVLPDGFTRDGVFASQLAQIIGECQYIDAFGMNCIQDAVHMKEMASRLELNGKILSLMPNAGYPTVLSHRVFYEGDPAFYAQSVADMANVGARILGGCCGTTPLHIKMISKLLPKAAGTEGRKTVAADETADTV
ncbi:MAG: homocysteine S-methyltransferase family protein, partial [Spirochaetales bacterium]|nr:homocysteine S-methyltransferase family protein [Spirochaetales bacterium]